VATPGRTGELAARNEAAGRHRSHFTMRNLAPLLKRFNTVQRFEEIVEGQKESKWRCALCELNQPNPKQRFTNHCQSKGHQERLGIASEILEAHGEVKSAEEFVRELPTKVRSLIGRSQRSDAAWEKKPHG
jgi:hypothetical protein